MIKRYVYLILLMFAGLCRGDDQPRTFYPFSFGGLEDMPVNDAVDLLMSLGYTALLPEGREANDLARFEEYLDRSELEGDAFTVNSYYVSHKVYENGYDDSVQRAAIDIMAARGGGTLWVPIRAVKKQTDPVDFEQVNNFIKGLFAYGTGEDDEGNYRNVNIILYPHVNNAYQSTVEAMSLVEEIDDPRFTVSINLVHEYHAGLSDPVSLSNTFHQAKGHIGTVILCGIQTNGFEIVSLEDSQHDLEPFLEIVRDSEYKGEVSFVNFNTGPLTNPSEYLADSMTEWGTLSTNVGLFAVPPAPFVMRTDFSGGDLALTWNSKMGKFYHLYSSTNLVDWVPYAEGSNTYVNLPTSGVGTNELTQLVPQGDQRFFRLEEDIRPAQ